MPYSDEQIRRLFVALGYAKPIKTECFGELEYPRPEVWDFHRSKARIKVALAPARTSKSFAGSWDMIPDILDFDRPEKSLIVGPDYDKASKEFNYVADALVHRRDEAKRKYGLDIPEPVQYYNTPKTGRMQIVWPWGAELHAKSAAHFSSVIGESWGAALLSETCELGPEVFYRALRTRCRRFIMPTTPGLKGMWVKQLYERSNEIGEKDVELFKFPPEANPLYDMDRFKAELKRVGPEDPYFREQFLGEWVFYGGRVFPGFQPEPVEKINRWQLRGGGISGGEGRVCIDMDPLEIPQAWKRVAGADFGFRDKTVYLWGAVAPDSTVIIYDEYYASQRSIREHAEEIRAKMKLNATPRIDDCVREPKGQALQISHDFSREYGIWSRPASNADRLSSRLHVQAYLDSRPEDGCPSLRIIKKQCPNLVRELLNLHYEDEDVATRREGKTEVWRGEDHATDALRYLLSSRPSPRHKVDEVDRYWNSLSELKRNRRRLARKYSQIGWKPIGG